jgi:hypothetical protein
MLRFAALHPSFVALQRFATLQPPFSGVSSLFTF